ncbi:MAG: hypothetical protein ACRDD1_09555, partial [Planctomycetia bacterium]
DRPPWDRASPKVTVLRSAAPVDVADGVVLLPCPVKRKTSLDDPTLWLAGCDQTNGADAAGATRGQGAEGRPAAVRIAVAHGSLKIRDDLPLDDHLIDRQAVERGRLDYLALGHWHSRSLHPDRDGVPRTAYSGVHEPMRYQGSGDVRTGWSPYTVGAHGGGVRAEFLDSGSGQALFVSIAAPGAAPVVEPLDVGVLNWIQEAVDLSTPEDVQRLVAELKARPEKFNTLLRLRLTGTVDAEAMMQLDELRNVLSGRYLLGELDATGLRLAPTADEVREVTGQGILRRVLEELRKESLDDDLKKRSVAERAVLVLYQLAREVGS